MRIRPATHADLPTLRRFEQELIAVERAFDADLRPTDVTYYDLEGLITSDESLLIVGESSGDLVASGYVQIREAKPIYHHRHIAYIGFLYVAPVMRGQGVVQRLIEALCAWARERGVRHAELGVYADNAAAIAAYERAGFSAISTTMVLPLEP